MRIRTLAFLAAALLAPAAASANFHFVYITEIFTGTVAAPAAQYVVLQAYSAGQNVVGGHSILTYNAEGILSGTYTFPPGPLDNDDDQMRILIATSEAAALFNVTADLAMLATLDPLGGKVCWDTSPVDCVAWGSYTGTSTGVGIPIGVPYGLEPGTAIHRRLDISGGPTTLDVGDDLANSSEDFVFGPPTPVNNDNQAGTIPASTCGNNTVQSLEQCDDGGTTAGDGCSATCTLEPEVTVPLAVFVDAPTSFVAGNGVFEPGESVNVDAFWKNVGTGTIGLTGIASRFTGPAGATYSIASRNRNYGQLVPGQETFNCNAPLAPDVVEGNPCYELSVSAPATRPAQHWDGIMSEVLSSTAFQDWSMHIGESFPDVPTGNLFYSFVENLFHNGVTGGCAGGNYCPANPVTRAQMAVFLLKGNFGAGFVPDPATGTVFDDVPISHPFAAWIEQLAGLGITGGCGGGNYCPDNPVTRQQMAVFLLKTLEGSAYDPPDCAGVFQDVPCTPGVGFSDWIEELYLRQITGGCSATPLLYCPTSPNNRGQMAAFLVRTFSLVLYGPPLEDQ